MIPWFWIWSPQLHYPWSGSVAQQIEPNTNWFFDSIAPSAGGARIEKMAFEYASYGKQLGLITEVLLDQCATGQIDSAKAASSLSDLQKIYDDIEALKKREFAATARSIVSDIERLKEQSPFEYELLMQRLGR